MEFRSAILFRGCLAFYSVFTKDGKSFKARLMQYFGAVSNTPPVELNGTNEGRHWTGNDEHKELMDDIGYDTKEHFNS